MTDLPTDWEHPNWDEYDRIHNWRNHVSDEIVAMWETFTPQQKQAIARNAESRADNEHWE